MEKFKKITKEILKKIPIFIFCVAFISLYNKLFDEQNSIVGVILLVGLLILFNAKLHIKAEISAPIIPILFVLMGLMSHIASINIFYDIILSSLFLFLSLVFTREDKLFSSYLPFIMGYIMLKGYNVKGIIFQKRMISLAVIGSIIGVIHYLVNRKNETSIPFKKLFEKPDFNDKWFRFSAPLFIMLILTMIITDLLKTKKGMWVHLTVLSMYTPLFEQKKFRLTFRIPAAILGSLVFVVLFSYLIPLEYQNIFFMLAGFSSMFMSNYFVKSIYNSFSALVSASVVFSVKEAILLRVCNNIFGVILSIIGFFVFKHIFKNKCENALAS